MGVLDQVTNMKKSGMSDNRIANQLGEQGFSPKEINDAMNQSKIKKAVMGAIDDPAEQPSIMPGGGTNTGGPPEGTADLSNEDLTPPPSYAKIPPAAQRSYQKKNMYQAREKLSNLEHICLRNKTILSSTNNSTLRQSKTNTSLEATQTSISIHPNQLTKTSKVIILKKVSNINPYSSSQKAFLTVIQ